MVGGPGVLIAPSWRPPATVGWDSKCPLRLEVSQISVAGRQLDLWWGSIPSAPENIREAESWLSADERSRAHAYASELARFRFTFGRVLLRACLALYTDRQPEELSFSYGRHGKPCLSGEDDIGYEFSVAHAGDALVLAVGKGLRVGVDVEPVNRLPKRSLGLKILSESEQRAASSLSSQRSQESLLRQWVLKEAIAKATGLGLSLPFESIDMAGAIDVPRYEGVWRSVDRSRAVAVKTFSARSGCFSAVACELSSPVQS